MPERYRAKGLIAYVKLVWKPRHALPTVRQGYVFEPNQKTHA
jgi:hypothetical protein